MIGRLSRRCQQMIKKQQYNLVLHEHQALNLLNSYRIPTLLGLVAYSKQEAITNAETLKKISHDDIDFVVKAQVHAGGRGKGYFKENGFQGGVHMATSVDEVAEFTDNMVGKTLITKQTGSSGKKVNSVLISERVFLRKEMYLSLVLDRSINKLVFLINSRGGVNIEEQGKEMSRVEVGFDGVDDYKIEEIVDALDLSKERHMADIKLIIKGIYKCFMEKDCTLLEVNPLGLTIDNRVKVCDMKVNIDDNSKFRQKDLFSIEDISQKDYKEIEADKAGLNYIALEGNIGCMVNGAGLAMATMDIIKNYEGMPANFLDVGGKADDQHVEKALKILNNDPQVEAILVNIFAGITKCDQIALGLIKGSANLGLKKPIVLRLKGTNYDIAQELIQDSGFNLFVSDDLETAAQKVVKMAKIMRMAKEAKVEIEFSS